jgi:hypothetical protein
LNQLDREVQSCYRINPRKRFLYLNANHTNEKTGEGEPEKEEEVIATSYDKRLNY